MYRMNAKMDQPIVAAGSAKAVYATSPLAAMEMGSDREADGFLPTVTITLTTLLWPGKAH